MTKKNDARILKSKEADMKTKEQVLDIADEFGLNDYYLYEDEMLHKEIDEAIDGLRKLLKPLAEAVNKLDEYDFLDWAYELVKPVEVRNADLIEVECVDEDGEEVTLFFGAKWHLLQEFVKFEEEVVRAALERLVDAEYSNILNFKRETGGPK